MNLNSNYKWLYKIKSKKRLYHLYTINKNNKLKISIRINLKSNIVIFKWSI